MTKDFNTERLEPLIFRIRGHRVVLDADLARLYGVSTKRFNEIFKRSHSRFPADFAFRLTTAELERLKAELASTIKHPSDSLGHMWSQFATTSRRRHSHRPWVFTEHGALMAANVLRSEHAVQMSIFLVRAFVRLREQVAANTAILRRLAEIDKKLLEHDSDLSDLYHKLVALLEPPVTHAIGFHTDID
jgi:hypothetical protein